MVFFWFSWNDGNTKLILRYKSQPRRNLIKKRKTARKDQISPRHLPPPSPSLTHRHPAERDPAALQNQSKGKRCKNRYVTGKLCKPEPVQGSRLNGDVIYHKQILVNTRYTLDLWARDKAGLKVIDNNRARAEERGRTRSLYLRIPRRFPHSDSNAELEDVVAKAGWK